MNVFVFSDNLSITKELIGGGRALCGDGGVSAVVAGTREEAAELAGLGADTVYWLGELGGRIVDDFVPTIHALLTRTEPDLLLVGSTVCGRAVAGRLAANFDTSAFVNAKQITVDGGVSATHVIYGGNGVRTERSEGSLFIATVPAGTYESAAAAPGGEVVDVAFVEPKTRIVKRASAPRKTGGSDILTAKKVVCAGRGFETAEDLEYAGALAQALGAAVGYTRPVTEITPPIVEGEPYIGVSGISVKPDLFVAVAVSGQAQHTTGILDSRVVVCINNDPNAPMFKSSDYGIVGDYKEVLPLLAEAVRGLNG